MKILITGASGYVGVYLLRELEQNYSGNELFAIYNSHPIPGTKAAQIKCSLTNFNEFTKIFKQVKPDVVYHLASVTPTRITNEPDGYIELFNHRAAEHIAGLCSEHNALMIYTSTDLVYQEDDHIVEDTSPLKPLSIYAKTKLMGEDAVRLFAEKHFILRFSLVYGFTLSPYTSFFDVSYKTLKEGKELHAFTDQYRKILYVENAAEILAKLPALHSKNATLNICGDEYISRYDMCVKMADAYGLAKFLIKKASCEDLTAYPAVKHLGLNNARMKALGLTTQTYKENLKRAERFKPR